MRDGISVIHNEEIMLAECNTTGRIQSKGSRLKHTQRIGVNKWQIKYRVGKRFLQKLSATKDRKL